MPSKRDGHTYGRTLNYSNSFAVLKISFYLPMVLQPRQSKRGESKHKQLNCPILEKSLLRDISPM